MAGPLTKAVEFYVRNTEERPKSYALGWSDLSEADREHSWVGTLACRFCGRFMVDLPPIQQPEKGWPDVVVLVCDHGFHRLDEP